MDSPERETSERRIQSLERGFEIVEYLYQEGETTVSELATELGTSTSTAHIYLKTLSDIGYVVKDGPAYSLSHRFLRFGTKTREKSKIYQAAQSEVDKLAAETSEVSALGVSERGQRILLYKAESSEAVYDNPPVGEYTYMHWTALGKAILGHLPRERVEEIVTQHGLPARTQQTIDEESELFAELETINENGYAIEDEERWNGIRSVAVPLFDDDAIVGSISVSGPKHRFDRDRIESELLDHLMRAKNVIEVRLAHE
ncbi:IclR family transcriptional regulator [Halopiger thermotolerans]